MAEKATCALDSNEMIGRWTLGYWQLTGGGALSNPRAQIMADRIGVPMYRQSNPRIHDVVGMGLLALIRLGRVKLVDNPGKIQFDGVLETEAKKRAVNDLMYAQFTAAREKIRPVFHALNRA